MNIDVLDKPPLKMVRRDITLAGAIQKYAGDLQDRTIGCIASSENVDRVGDTLIAKGCLLDNFRRNPVALYQHNASSPIGRVNSIGIGPRGDTLQAQITFAKEGTSEIADTVFRLVQENVLSAVSVGFCPIEAAYDPKGDGIIFRKWELLELSIVSVPANASALIYQRSIAAEEDDSRAAIIARAKQTLLEVRGPDPVSAAELRQRVRETLAQARA